MLSEKKYKYKDWDTKKYGKFPKPRQLRFVTGNKYKRTIWIEMVNKTDADRDFLYHELYPFICNLADYAGIYLRDNQRPSNTLVGMFVNDRIIPLLKEWMMEFNVGWVYDTQGGRDYSDN